MKRILGQGFKGEQIMLLLKNQGLTLKSKTEILDIGLFNITSHLVDIGKFNITSHLVDIGKFNITSHLVDIYTHTHT